MRRRVLKSSVLAAVLLAVAAAPAAAAVHGLAMVPMGVLGIDFPSVKDIVGDVVKFFFTTFLDALVPDWLQDGSVRVIKRLVTVPNPADARVWPTLAQLSEGMRWIALPLLSLAVVASWVQQWLRELSGRPGSVAVVLPRTVLAALLLAVYPLVVSNAVALVNSITNAMLSLPAVQEGLQRTVGIVFAGTLLSGNGLLLALLGIAGVLLAVGLFMLSVCLLTVFAIAFVAAPLAIVCSVLDETHGIWAAWRYTLLTAGLVPIGWCVLFATAGAFMVDMTNWSGGVGGALGARFVGVFAALIVLWLAVRWPLMLWGTMRAHIAGALLSVGPGRGVGIGSGGGGGASGSGRVARATLQRTALRGSDAVTGALGSARVRAGSAARTALGVALPRAGAAMAAGAGAAAAIGGRLGGGKQVGAVAKPALAGARAKTQQVRSDAQTGLGHAKAAYASSATSREAAAAGLAGAVGRPTARASASGPAPQERRGDGVPATLARAGRSSSRAPSSAGSAAAPASRRASGHVTGARTARDVVITPAPSRAPRGAVPGGWGAPSASTEEKAPAADGRSAPRPTPSPPPSSRAARPSRSPDRPTGRSGRSER
jgi:hypothetical protein